MARIHNFELTHSYDLRGQWWLPHLGNTSGVGGVLEYRPGSGVTLRLLDAIETPDMIGGGWSYPGGGVHEPTIHGATFDGPLEITLIDCESPGSPLPRGAATLQNQTFRCRYALFGVHEDDSFATERCLMKVSGMEAWAGASGIGEPPRDHTGAAFQISWERPDVIAGSTDDATYELGWHHYGSHGWRSASISAQPSLDIASTEALPPKDWIRNWASPTCDLSTLLMNEPMAVTSMTMIANDDAEDPRERKYVDVLYRARSTDVPDRDQLPLLGIDHGISDLGSVMDTWYQMGRNTLRPVVAVSLRSQYQPGNLESDILFQASSLEAYHRTQRPSDGRLPSEIESMIVSRAETFLDGLVLDEPTSQSLEGRLTHLVDPTFKARVRRLVIDTARALPDLVHRPGKFAKALADVRNDVAHGEAISRSYDEAYVLSLTAAWIIRALVFQQLGILDEIIAAAVTRTYRYNWLVRQTSEFKWGTSPEDQS